MNGMTEFAEEECEEFDRRLVNGFAFIREILDDPSILDHIPSGSKVESIPIAEREPERHYDIETPLMVAIVTPGGMEDMEPADRSNGRTRRIDRDETTRLRRIRAAHR